MDDKGNSYSLLARSAADLCAFMVVCQRGQLSAAARDMKVSQPSLSQRIRNLETALGTTLFERTAKGVTLTRDGDALYRRVKNPMAELANKFNTLSKNGKQERVLISSDFAFAYFWLLPRLPAIRQSLGDVEISILTSDQPRQTAVHETDLVVHMANLDQIEPGMQLLFEETVGIVCSPAFKNANAHIRSPADLKTASQLLHLVPPSRDSDWCTWEEWLNAQNVDATDIGKGTVFNNYEMVIRAAQDGQGIALAWYGLIDDLVRDAELTPLLEQTYKTKRGYFITTVRPDASPKLRELRDWILGEIRA